MDGKLKVSRISLTKSERKNVSSPLEQYAASGTNCKGLNYEKRDRERLASTQAKTVKGIAISTTDLLKKFLGNASATDDTIRRCKPVPLVY
ncbi:hypothetical protein GWI33_016075 [Rhynchophorus ferrugineus]|uniref:Uncharacterized protein n=1 Tax=Rhynchophorus ferrugineus TaxID=354439 RepID=A0A834HYL8_RHYFE|nr:hypothetical protein GWI33_016075 [Rhynchophorus ferrugineus]